MSVNVLKKLSVECFRLIWRWYPCIGAHGPQRLVPLVVGAEIGAIELVDSTHVQKLTVGQSRPNSVKLEIGTLTTLTACTACTACTDCTDCG
jgi:hypothetical protein